MEWCSIQRFGDVCSVPQTLLTQRPDLWPCWAMLTATTQLLLTCAPPVRPSRGYPTPSAVLNRRDPITFLPQSMSGPGHCTLHGRQSWRSHIENRTETIVSCLSHAALHAECCGRPEPTSDQKQGREGLTCVRPSMAQRGCIQAGLEVQLQGHKGLTHQGHRQPAL